MLRISSSTSSSTILQSIDMADQDEVGESGSNRTNLSNLSMSTKSTKAGYLIPRGANKGGGNTKKSVKAARSFNYLTPAA